MMYWERVKRDIKEEGTTQEWVAKTAGVSFETFRGWIAKGRLPRVDYGVMIAKALNTSVEAHVEGSSSHWQPPTRIADIVEDLLLLNEQELGVIRPMVHGLAARHIDNHMSSQTRHA